MAEGHLTEDLLRAVARGELPPRAIVEIGVSHLMGLCETCRREIEAFWRKAKGDTAAQGLSLLPALVGEQVSRLEEDLRRAARDLRELLDLPAEDRLGRIRRARGRFRSPLLGRMLLEESRKRLPDEAEEAMQLAELARTVAQHIPYLPGSFDLLALANAEKANALRILDKVVQAEETFGHVRLLVRDHEVTDPEVLARVAELEASLRKDQRRFAEMEELLARAALHYGLSGNGVGIGRVLVKLADVSFYRGDVDRALTEIRRAAEAIPAEADPRLYMCARYNLARYLVEAGEHEQAAELLSTDADLYCRFPDAWTQLRVAWLHGKIAARRGASEEAERIFLETRDGFVARGNGYDAATVCLEDLAPLYLREGRAVDLRRVADEMYPIFQSQDIHREALTALVIFREAARREELTLRKVRTFAAYLREARCNPGLVFQEE